MIGACELPIHSESEWGPVSFNDTCQSGNPIFGPVYWTLNQEIIARFCPENAVCAKGEYAVAKVATSLVLQVIFDCATVTPLASCEPFQTAVKEPGQRISQP